MWTESRFKVEKVMNRFNEKINMQKKRKCTLKDVAREANVSVGTVSHYLNNANSVKLENRQRIKSVISQLGYTPNISARSLASGKSKNIILFVLSERVISPTTWLHQLPMIQTAHDLLSANGYSLQICIVYEDDYDCFICKVRNCVESKAADGILLLSVWKIRDDLIDYLVSKHYPFVCLDNEGDRENVQYVCFDNQKLMSDMVDVLYHYGHRRIAYINVHSHQQDMHLRYLGYVYGMHIHELPLDEDNILYGDFSIESGYQCVLKALGEGRKFTAILCGNDNMAVGAFKALTEHGLRVPEDISLIGVDNSIAANACSISLQTVEFDMQRLAEVAVKLLLEDMLTGNTRGGILRLGYKTVQGCTLEYV